MSSDRSLKDINDHSQNNFLKTLIHYCEQNARDLVLIEHLKKGICAGLIVLDAYANYVHELDEKRELTLPKDDVFWLNNIIYKLSTWRTNKPFPRDPEDPFVQDIERFLSHLISLGNYVYQPLIKNQWDLETLLLDTHNRTFKSVFRFVEPIYKSDLCFQMDHLVTEGTWTSIIAGEHATYVRKKEGIIYYFDPNSVKGKKSYETTGLELDIFLSHFKFNLFKASQFIFYNYRFAKVHEEKEAKLEAKLEAKVENADMAASSEMNLLKILKLTDKDPKPYLLREKDINERASRWSDFSILAHAIISQVPIPVVQHYLDNGANANISDKDGQTPLHNLIILGHKNKLEIISMLLKAGADPLIKNKFFATPIYNAMFVAAKFYEENHPPLTSEKQTEADLHNSVLKIFSVDEVAIERLKTTEMFESFLKTHQIFSGLVQFSLDNNLPSSAKVKQTFFIEMVTAEVHVLNMRGEFDRAYDYIKRQTLSVLKNEIGLNLLSFAIENKHEDLVNLFLIDLASTLKIASEKFHIITKKFIKLASGLFLISESYSVEQRSRIKDEVLMNAFKIFKFDPEIAYIQLKENSQTVLNIPNASGMWPLHWAARIGDRNFIEEFLNTTEEKKSEEKIVPECDSKIKLAIDVNQRDVRKKTALYYAVLRQDYKLIDLLLKNGAILDSDHTYSPLLQALRTKEFALAKKLSPKSNVEFIQDNYIAFKKLDKLAHRLGDAIEIYSDKLVLKNAERTASCDAIISAVNDAYDLSLKTGDSDAAYHQLLMGTSTKKGVLSILNEVRSSHKKSYYQGLISLMGKQQTTSRLEGELEEALIDSGLHILKNDKGVITAVEPTMEEKAMHCIALLNQKMNSLTEKYTSFELLFIQKIRTILKQYGFTTPLKTLEIINELAKSAFEKPEDLKAGYHLFRNILESIDKIIIKPEGGSISSIKR